MRHDAWNPVDHRPFGIDQGHRYRHRRRNRGNGVRTVVPRVRLQGWRSNLTTHPGGPPIEHFLDSDGHQRHNQRNSSGIGIWSITQSADGLRTHADRDSADGEANHHRHQGLDAPVAVRMVLVGRCRPVANPEDDRDVGDRIGKAVERVGKHCLAVTEDTGGGLGCGQREVAEQAHPAHLAHPRGLRYHRPPLNRFILTIVAIRSRVPRLVQHLYRVTDANQGQSVVLTLAEESSIVADNHPAAVELESGGADNRPIDLDSTTRVDRVSDETGDADQSWPSEYLSTAPAAVVRAG
jgi:hypothetical protein